MAVLTLNREKLRTNFLCMKELFEEHNVSYMPKSSSCRKSRCYPPAYWVQILGARSPEIDEWLYGKTSFRGILDIGLLDVSPQYLFPIDPKIEILGASSDMLIVNLGNNLQGHKVGETLSFRLKYMGALCCSIPITSKRPWSSLGFSPVMSVDWHRFGTCLVKPAIETHEKDLVLIFFYCADLRCSKRTIQLWNQRRCQLL